MVIMKRIISIALALMMIVSVCAVSVISSDAAEKSSVRIRIEGSEKTVMDTKYSFDPEEETTLGAALEKLAQTFDINIVGLDKGYISEINGEKAGKFGGWDGWYYSVNDETPSVGVNDYQLKESDENICIYYGGYPCQIPVPDFSKVREGVISFKSYDAKYDESGNATYSWNPVTDAVVTFNGDKDDKYTTDSDGVIKFSPEKYATYSTVFVQIEKTDASGAPAVCRLKSNTGFSPNGETVFLRIEGAEETYFDSEVLFDNGDTVASILQKANDSANLKINGIDKGYVDSVMDEKAGSFGGWDGWYYAVNGKAASVGISDYKVSASDDIVMYYGDYPCQFPVADYSQAQGGFITITSYDAKYDESGNATYSYEPVVGASIKFTDYYGVTDTFTTDSEGKVDFDKTKYKGSIKVEISKNSASGAPAVCRFSGGECFAVMPVPITLDPVVSVVYKNSMYINSTQKIMTSVTNKSSDGKLTYKSSDKKYASVSSDGKLTAKKAGKVTITVKYKDSKNTVTKSIKITIKNPSLKKKNGTVKVGKTVKINVNGSGKITYKSNNNKIAKVTKKGVVKGVKKGKTTIIVSANGKKLKFKVTVKKK